MKKFFLLGLIFIGCNQPTRLESAKEVAESILMSADSVEKGYITKQKMYQTIQPRMDKLASLRTQLTKSETDSLDAFRMRIVMELVNRRVNRNQLNIELK